MPQGSCGRRRNEENGYGFDNFNMDRFTPWTKKLDHGSWAFSMVQLTWFDFLLK